MGHDQGGGRAGEERSAGEHGTRGCSRCVQEEEGEEGVGRQGVFSQADAFDCFF